jgi:hypothetical protein
VKAAGAAGLATRPLTGVWFRAIQPQFWPAALHTRHTRNIPSRFNSGHNQFEVFYLAENHLVALLEVGALLGAAMPGGLVPSPHRAWSVLNVSVRLKAIVDLTRSNQRAHVRTSVQELTGDWRGYSIRHQLHGGKRAAPLAPTQRLAQAIYNRKGVEAVLTYSARQSYSRALVVFPQRLLSGSRITFRDPVSNRMLSLP